MRTWYFHTPVSISSIHCVRLFFCDCICDEKLDRLIIAQTRIMPAAAQAFPITETSALQRLYVDQEKLTHQLPSDQCPPKTRLLCVATNLHFGRRGLDDTGESDRTRSAISQVPRSHFGGHQNER